MNQYNILAIDDEVNNLHALKRALRREYNVFSATNGEDALTIMEQNEIALIIADHRMPGMTGLEVLAKTMQKHPDTIRIMLTSYTDEKLLLDAINTAHVHGFLPKPWEPEEIKSIVGEWITAYQQTKHRTQQIEEKDKQIESLQRRLETATTANQPLPEHRQIPWWRRWFRRNRSTKSETRQ